MSVKLLATAAPVDGDPRRGDRRRGRVNRVTAPILQCTCGEVLAGYEGPPGKLPALAIVHGCRRCTMTVVPKPLAAMTLEELDARRQHAFIKRQEARVKGWNDYDTLNGYHSALAELCQVLMLREELVSAS